MLAIDLSDSEDKLTLFSEINQLIQQDNYKAKFSKKLRTDICWRTISTFIGESLTLTALCLFTPIAPVLVYLFIPAFFNLFLISV